MNHNETIERYGDVSNFSSSLPADERYFRTDPPDGLNGRTIISRRKHYLGCCWDAGKFWFRAMNWNRKWLKQELVWRLKEIYRFHSTDRFRRFAQTALNRASGKWRMLTLHPAIVHTLFIVCLEDTPEGRQVVKLPLCSTGNSMKLVNALKDPDELSRYAEVLTSLTLLPGLGEHCVKVTNVRRNGGYTSDYVDGVNLAEFRFSLFHGDPLPRRDRQKLMNSLEALIDHMNEYYRQNGGVIGDWSLNNLVFDPNRAVIVNVDAEGFYTYSSEKSWWNWQRFQVHLRALGELIRLLDSDSIEDSKMADLFRVRDRVQGRGQCGVANLVTHGHSLELNSRRFRGQPDIPEHLPQAALDFNCRCRSCLSRNFVLERLAQVPFDFRNKVVLDLGCRMGEALHALAGTIQKGYGFDVDPDCVNAAHLTRGLNDVTNLEFFTFHPEQQNPALMKCFLLRQSVDICFLFATRNWFEQWPAVVAEAAKLCPAMLFEEEEILQHRSHQVDLLQQYYGKIELVAEALDDNGPFSLGTRRRLYLCTQRKTPATGLTESRSRPPVHLDVAGQDSN
jgi:hypothetical protein